MTQNHYCLSPNLTYRRTGPACCVSSMVSFWVKRPGLRTIKSKLIPKTNSAVEMVIRRFDQHYQNFGGFDIREAAQLYLAVFEKLYRFTPFSDDTQFVTKITFWQRDRRPPNN